jgi:hypothetical protein
MSVYRRFAIEKLRAWIVSVIREGTAPPPAQPPPRSAYVTIMNLEAAASLVADRVSIDAAAAATGVGADELRRWLARHRVRR